MACSLFVTLTGYTGDCSNTNSGAFGLTIDGTAPDYTIQWINPSYGTFPLGAGVTGYSVNSLSAGTYSLYVVDSCPSGNTYSLLNVYISSGSCVSILDSSNTSCGFNNGSITAATSNLYFASTYYLYEINDGFISSGVTQNTSFEFNSLSAGTYYVIADDGGGCSGKSESCIIKSSSTLNFGLYQINNSACVNSLGSLYVTGLTGTPPYTYSWLPNGETTSFITGLTNGSYSVVVTDGLGCTTSQGAIIGQVPTLGTILLNDIQPTCFSATGETTLYISGGTAPYHIQGSNGEIAITFSTIYTFTGLPAGYFSVVVTDAGLCQSNAYTTLLTPSALSVVTINVTNSNCNNTDGEISVSVFGGAAPYTYTLIDSNTNSQIGIQPVQNGGFIFTSLGSDTYTLLINDSSNLCPYSGTVVVNNNVLFTLTAQTTSTTCGQPNGSVTLGITTGGTAPYRYQINGFDILNVTGLTYSFTNLLSGNYTAIVTDANLCSQTLPFTIINLGSLDFVLSSTNPSFGNNGEITTLITDGTPPFTLNWSSNVNGQTGLTVTALTAGTYVLSITDSLGCTQTRSSILTGFNLVSSFETYNICEGALIDNGSNVRKGPQQMLIEGFTDLTSGDTNCILNQAIFEVEVTLSGVSATTTATTFYTGTSINDFPGDDDYYYAVRSLLLGFSGITDVIIEPVQNQITIATICNPSAEYVDAEIIIGIKIYYDISCEDTAPPVLAPFIFTVDTTKLSAGSSLVDQFQLPTVLGGYYDFDVDWGDGNTDVINTWNDVNTLHTYTGVGTYQIIINGQFSGWTFNNSGDRAKVLEVKQWGILELGDSPGHFYGCVNLDLSGTTDVIDLSTTTTFLQSFRNCTSITTINNAEFWDVSTITDMTETFRNATSFNHPIGSWDVSNVTTTIRMFQTAFDFNQDISGWDVSNLVNASNMFTSATSFNQPLNSWNVSNITNMSGMFGSTLLFNQPLSGWNVSNVTNMSNMFSNAAVFNQDISTWDVSNVTTMLSMFATATSFNQPLNGWNVSNVTTMFGMFQNASSFDQPIDLWNVSNVTVMTGMFNNTITFNQDISTWDVSNVTDMTSMLDNCGMNQTKYEALLVNWNLLPSLQLNVNFGVSGRQYQIGSPSDTARSNIIGTYSWTFIGDTAVP